MKIILSHTSILPGVLHWIWNCFLFLSFLCYCCYLKWFHHALTDWLDCVFIFRVKFYFVSFFLLGKNKNATTDLTIIDKMQRTTTTEKCKLTSSWLLFGWLVRLEIHLSRDTLLLFLCGSKLRERARFTCQSIATAVMCDDCIGALPFSFIGLYLNQY